MVNLKQYLLYKPIPKLKAVEGFVNRLADGENFYFIP
jgi:hypothetical protein